MDKIVVIIPGLENDPGCRGHTCKGPDSKQRYFGKFASPSSSLFRVVFEFGLFFEGETLVHWKIIRNILSLPINMCPLSFGKDLLVDLRILQHRFALHDFQKV